MSSTDIPALIDRIEDELYEQYPPADPAAVEALAGPFRELFGIELPPAYRELLLRSNGLGADGLIIFATADGDPDSPDQPLGVIESNRRLTAGTAHVATSLRFIGERFDQLLAYDTTDGRWKLVDSTAWVVDSDADIVDSFADLVIPLLTEALA